jgi:uncharacterized protein DUF4038/uncharacterized protein DUF5060/collagenase-like protein with putative collagen-binding domain
MTTPSIFRSRRAGQRGVWKFAVTACALLGMAFGGSCSNSSGGRSSSAPSQEEVSFSQSSSTVDGQDYVELEVDIFHPPSGNPFIDGQLTGSFGPAQGGQIDVEGFCDSDDGSVYRIRFMPAAPGVHHYTVTYRRGGSRWTHEGTFTAVDGRRRGMLGVDPAHPWHFLWQGTGEHCYFNGTTAFLLMGWDDDQVITGAIDRLRDLEVNRIRVMLDARSDHFWTEPIEPGGGFQAHLEPWPARDPQDVNDPGFDYTRFNLTHWRKFERMLRHARDRDMIISVVFAWNDTQVHPAAGGADELRYFHYAVARLGAFSNVTWDLGDDLDGFRSDSWTHEMGSLIEKIDGHHHLATSHPVSNEHQDRASSWFGFTSFQEWNRPLHQFMLDERELQRTTGRIIPQVNEEYGYEDHYPGWAPYTAPAASADANRRAAWEMAMAGGYQTTGETAKRGTGVAPDTGGGFVNGRGDDTMVMLKGYAHMVRFFTALEWWKGDPHDELVTDGAFCFADPGQFYVVYLPQGGQATATLEAGSYAASWFNPRTGAGTAISMVEDTAWTSPPAPDGDDWVILLTRETTRL